jgi:uncharacterized repeat protein (TIGR01451 family)
MKIFSSLRMFALLAFGLMVASIRAEAQGFGISVTSSTNVIAVSNSLTYTINVTNLTGETLEVFVTNTFPATAQLLGASITPGLAITVTNANGFSFNNITLDPSVPVSLIQTMTVTAEPTQGGLFTNTVVVAIFGVTNITAYLGTQVTTNAAVLPQADLAVAITGPPSAVYTNDWMVYGVSVTNLGPDTEPNVFLTNTLPTGVGFKSVSPSNKTFTISIQSSNVIFNLGTLTNGAFRNFLLTVQPTNAGVLPFVSVVSTNNSVLDPDLTNNLASNNIPVLSYPAGQLSATIVSTQQYDPQNGLVEQIILVSNVGPNAVASARVVVTGLTTNQLFNAVGTNNGSPFVVYAAPLDTNQSVNLLLQFFASDYFSFTNSQLHPFAVTNLNLAPPAAAAVSTNVNITRIVKLTSGSPLIIGSMLIEWPSITNRTYTVVYSDNVLFSNAMMAMPSVVAPANRTQWIDYGPPTTVSAPPNSSNRFYRVFLNP